MLLYGLEQKRKEEDPIALHFFSLMPELTKENLNQEKVDRSQGKSESRESDRSP